MNGIVLYIKESYNELVHKVTWPSWTSLLSSTRLVLIGSIVFALIVFVYDSVFNTFLGGSGGNDPWFAGIYNLFG
jgi:preprotein translocase subunit SecE